MLMLWIVLEDADSEIMINSYSTKDFSMMNTQRRPLFQCANPFCSFVSCLELVLRAKMRPPVWFKQLILPEKFPPPPLSDLQPFSFHATPFGFSNPIWPRPLGRSTGRLYILMTTFSLTRSGKTTCEGETVSEV